MDRRLGKADIIWSYIGQISNLGIHIILTPIIAIKLSSYELGLWYTFTSLFTMVTFFDTSFSPLVLKNASYCFSGAKELVKEGIVNRSGGDSPNYDLLSKLQIVVKRLYCQVGIGAALMLLIFGSMYIRYVSREYYDIEYIIAWIIYVIGIAIYISSMYIPALLKGIGKIVEAQQIMATSRIIQFVLSIVLLLCNKGILALAVGFFVGNSLIGVLSLVASSKHLKFNKYIVKSTEISKIRGILWYNSKKMLLLSIGRYMGMQGNTLVCSTFLSLEVAGKYGLTVQALQAITSIGAIWIQTSIPIISGAYIEKNMKKVRQSFSVGMIVQWSTTLIGEVCLIICGNYLLAMIGANTRILEANLLIPLAVTYFIMSNYMDTNLLLEAQNKIPHMRSETIAGILVIIISVAGVSLISANILVVVWSQVLIPCLYNGWMWPRKVWGEMGMTFAGVIRTGIRELKDMITKP